MQKALTNFNNLDEPVQSRIWEAFEKLATNNPKIVEQLEKLAELKETSPIKWAMGLKALGLNK